MPDIPADIWSLMLQNAPTVIVLLMIAFWQEKRLSSCNVQMQSMLNRLLDIVTDEDTDSR